QPPPRTAAAEKRIRGAGRPADCSPDALRLFWSAPHRGEKLMRAFIGSLLAIAFAMPAAAAESSLFRPDPLSVQREGKGYRYPQAGWIVLHIEGEPYDRGYQHGKLMAPEIAAFVRCVAAEQGHKDPAGAWRITRTLVNSLFLRK